MDDDIVHSPIESDTFNMEEINEVDENKKRKKHRERKKNKNAVAQCPDPEDPSPMPVISSENEEITETSAGNKNQTTNLTSLEDQDYRSINQSRRSSLPSIDSVQKANCCFLRYIYCCMQNIFKKPTAESPKQIVDPRTLTKKQKIKIVALRLLMILHTFLTIWRVTVEKNNPLYWILTLSITLQILEGLYSWHSDRRIKKRSVYSLRWCKINKSTTR